MGGIGWVSGEDTLFPDTTKNLPSTYGPAKKGGEPGNLIVHATAFAVEQVGDYLAHKINELSIIHSPLRMKEFTTSARLESATARTARVTAERDAAAVGRYAAEIAIKKQARALMMEANKLLQGANMVRYFPFPLESNDVEP